MFAAEQREDRRQHFEIAPIASGDDFTGSGPGPRQQERAVDHRRGKPARFRRKVHSDPASEPEQHQGEERRSLHRQAPGPVGDCGQQKPGDDSCNVAEQHFVHMPIDRRENARCFEIAIKKRQPEQDRHPGIE